MRSRVSKALGTVLTVAALPLAGCAGHRTPVHDAAPISAISASDIDAGAELSLLKATPAVKVSTGPGLDDEQRRKGAEVIAHAEGFAKSGKLPSTARRDCSGFVLAAYRAAGAPLEVPPEAQTQKNLSAMLHTWSEQSHRSFRKGSPVPGDVVFFRDTIVDQGLKNHVTHIALVESVDDDGTVRLLHFMGGKIRRDPMNLSRPTDPSANGWLRKKRHAKDPALAGELFVAYARFE